MRPVPPGHLDQRRGDIRRKALAQDARGRTGDDRIGGHVAGDHGIGTDDRAVADGNAGHNDCAMADPDIIADGDARGLPVRPVAGIDAVETEIFVRPVGDLVRGDALHRMFERVDADIRRNRAELADGRVDRLAMALEIGEVADFDVAQQDARADRDEAPETAALELGRRMDLRFGIVRQKGGHRKSVYVARRTAAR